LNNQWTDEQREAIFSRGGNLLVAAAAGAGKTTVLVERVISLITDPANPVDVDRLLVVTFTNAAAAEMRERIGRALAQEAARRPGVKRLRRQMVLLGRACISTMHSFCLDLLREYFYRLELDPAFRVADETESALLRMEALEDLFERRYAAKDNLPFTALVDCYGGRRDDTQLQELVLDAYKFARSTPRPEEWLDRLPENFHLPEDASLDRLPWCADLKKALEMELTEALAALDLALKISRRPGGPGAYLDNLEAEREMVARLLGACSAGASWGELHASFGGAGFGRLKQCKRDEADPGLVEQVKKLRDGARKKITGLQEQHFPRLPEELLADLRAVAPLARELAGLVQDFADSYRRAKAARGVVDFSDLEHYALGILTERGPDGPAPSRAALEMRERFAEVLVDEYQDTNDVQEAILQLVSRQGEGKPNLFMVGDVKQSIYRFRLAEPGLFLNKYRSYPAGGGGRERRLDLTRNFRSRRGVVEAVNFIFRQLMTPAVAELAYEDEAALVYGAGYPPPPAGAGPDEAVELRLIERDDAGAGFPVKSAPEDRAVSEEGEGGGNGPDEEDDLDAVQREARLVAGRIKELVTGAGGDPLMIYDRDLKAYRPPAYRDVVVLLRATAGYANSFIEEFRREGVPAYAETATGYFEATEVETVLSLLKIIDNSRQDVPLAGVLRSPVVGLKAADLAGIRLAAKDGDFYEAVVAAAALGRGELSDRLTDFLAKLENWRTAARQGGLADLIWSIYRETGYYDFVGGLPSGGQRQANLRSLYHRARQYESTAFRGLFLFLRFIERLREGGRDLGLARALGEKENVVRIMSIHKSKGLEFPVVFVAGLGKKFNFKDLNKTMLFHKSQGLGPQLVDPEAGVTYPTVARLALKHRLKLEALAEEMRILYVALTRAREKLILVGSARKLAECARRWCGPVGADGPCLPDGMLAGAASYLDWLAPAVARHRDGAAIRELGRAGEEPPESVASGPSAWKVFIDAGRVVPGAGGEAEPELFSRVRKMEPLEPGPLADTVKARLEWRYPAAAVAGRAAKASVTEIKRRFDLRETEEGHRLPDDFHPVPGRRPRFLQEERGLTAAEAGSALHLVMQSLDLDRVSGAAAIKEQIAGMVERELLTHEQASAAPVERIAAFFAGPLGRRVLAGRAVRRELPFTLALPAGELYPDLRAYPGEVALAQGVVDCLVDEGDGYLLLDYKTDRVARDQVAAAVDRYRAQLSLYTRAVEEILGRRVKEKYLYFFNPGLGVRCD